MEPTELSQFEQRLSYEFINKELLMEALRHSSYVNEQDDLDMRDNERLEFLGDAVLNLIIGHILMQRYPDLKEGELTRMRASLVNETRLATITAAIDLGARIRLGKGELQTRGRHKNSILANAFEALLAAVYLDGGFDAAFQIIETHFDSQLKLLVKPASDLDYKSQLQELTQETHRETPIYSVIGESGPDHDKTFNVRVTLASLQAQGVGKSKKTAEQDAAQKALEDLINE